MAAPRIPVISNVAAQAQAATDALRDLLVRQVKSPVLWADSMGKLIESGIEEFYEIGPGRVLTGLLKRIDRKIRCQPVNDS